MRRDERASKGREREVVDLAEATRILGTSKPTLYRWLRAGRIKGFKAGGQWRFYRDDLIKFLEYDEPLAVQIDLPEVEKAIAFLERRLSERKAKEEAEP
jgi:excisionase family DNA binding protein